MNRPALRAFLASLALMFAAPTQAALFRAYLASDGSDANPCTLPLPCRLLPAALAAVASGGEIWMLDSANFNTNNIAIGKSVSILAVPGAVGSVVAGNGNAISVAGSGLTVALRNLVVVPLPGETSASGISLSGASTLIVEESVFANLPSPAIQVIGTGTARIANTVFRGLGSYAIALMAGATASVSRSSFVDSFGGVLVEGISPGTTTRAAVSQSVFSGTYQALFALTTSDASASIYATHCAIDDATYALHAETQGVGTATVSVGYSMVANNEFGWYRAGVGSLVRTLGNNQFVDNAGTYGAVTPLPPQ